MHAADSTFNPEERERVVRLLLDSGANISIMASAGYRNGWRAVEFAADRENQSVAKILRDTLLGLHSQPSFETVCSIPSGKAFLQDELDYGSKFHNKFDNKGHYLWDYRDLKFK